MLGFTEGLALTPTLLLETLGEVLAWDGAEILLYWGVDIY